MNRLAYGFAGVLLFGSLFANAQSVSPIKAPSSVQRKAAPVEMRLADGDSKVLSDQLITLWEPSLRESRGWDTGAIDFFRRELQGMPSDTLREALSTRNWETLQTILMNHQGSAAAARLATAVEEWRSGVAIDETRPEEATFKKGVMKALGDADKDLVFVPIQPCTTWDTRFSSIPAHQGQIGPTANKPGFVYHSAGGSFDWSAYGGNPSCTDTAVVATYGVIPYAVVYTLYTANATGNGWVTAYRDGDPDPSSATISLYYTAGPTRSTTVVTRVGRANAQAYDIRVASQYSSVDVAVSVIGYFIKSAATALDCVVVNGTNSAMPASSAGFNAPEPACAAGYKKVGTFCRTEGFGARLSGFNQSADGGVCNFTNSTASPINVRQDITCCRVPGR